MPTYRHGEGFMHIKMARRRGHPHPPQCRADHTFKDGRVGPCCQMSHIVCDAPVGDGECGMPLCDDHALKVGPDQHRCPKHREVPPRESKEQES